MSNLTLLLNSFLAKYIPTKPFPPVIKIFFILNYPYSIFSNI